MDNLELLIANILNYNNHSSLEEVKVDLQRIVNMEKNFEATDEGYINYLFKHYRSEISFLYSIRNIGNSNQNISDIQNIRNFLIKIFIIRTCIEKGINYEISLIDNVEYCLNLLNQK